VTRRSLLALVFLLSGCSEALFVPPVDVEVPAPVCDVADPPPVLHYPLRAHLTSELDGVTVNVAMSQPVRMELHQDATIEVAAAPDSAAWGPALGRGEVFAETTGTTNGTPLNSLLTNRLGGVAGWIRVDVPGLCTDGELPTELTVTLSTEDDAVTQRILLGGGA